MKTPNPSMDDAHITGNDQIPMEQRLDLLVDGELPEPVRAELVAALGHEPTGLARDIAVRFLEQQVEKQAVRQLMAGGRLVPVEMMEGPVAEKAVVGRIGWRVSATLATAAGLLIAVTSAMVTYYVTQPPAHTTMQTAEVAMELPAEAVSYDRNLTVPVPVVNMERSPDMFSNDDNPHVAKRSWVIRRDGTGKAMVVPVNTLKAAVY